MNPRKRYASGIIGAACLALSACATATPEQKAGGCTTNDLARLSGLKTGGKINPPDPATEKGRAILAEIAETEIRCGIAPDMAEAAAPQ